MRLACSFVLLLWPAVAWSSTARQLPLHDLVKPADLVVRGHTVRKDSFWEGTRILTLTRIAVDDVWVSHAGAPAFVDVVTAGGVVGEIGQRVEGMAQLPQQATLVLHLKRSVTGEYHTLGMGQGLWVVDAQGRLDRKVTRPYAGHLLAAGDAESLPTTLDELRRAVMEIARGP